MGTAANGVAGTRIGLRVRREIRRAVDRNRLKRQLRAVLFSHEVNLVGGVDVVVVAHPRALPVTADRLREELLALCRKQKLLT